MRLIDNTGYKVIDDAKSIFLGHYQDAEFLQAVREFGAFNYTRDTAAKIADRINDANFEMQLTIFEDKKTRAIASTTTRNGVKTISFNTAKLEADSPKLLEERVETVMHEFLHGVGYRHFTNFNWFYNRKTVPYKVAELFVNHLKKKKVL